MSAPPAQDPLLVALQEAGVLKLEDCPEYKSARKARREGDHKQVGRATERLRSTIELRRRVNELTEWFADQKVALAAAGLDSDDFNEIFRMSDRQQQRTEPSLSSFIHCFTRLEKLKAQLVQAVAERQLMKANVDAVRSLMKALQDTHKQHKSELRYLSNVLGRIEGQLLHGYTPDPDQLRDLRQQLETIAADKTDAVAPMEDHLQLAAVGFLDRHQGKLSATELRSIREELAHTISATDPTVRWEFWNKLGSLEREHAPKLSFQVLPERKTTKATLTSISNMWEMLTDLALARGSQRSQEIRGKLGKTLEQKGGVQAKSLGRIQIEIQRLKPLED